MRGVREAGLCLAVLVLLPLSGCEKHGGGQSTGANSNEAGSDDESAVLASPQFTAPIMLHLTGDANQQAQQLAALNGVDPRNTQGAAYEKTDFWPCSIDKQQELDNLNPGVSPLPAEHGALVNALFNQRIYRLDTYVIQYPNASSTAYGTSNTFYCAVINDGVLPLSPDQAALGVHRPLDVVLGHRMFKSWTYRNQYTTQIPGHGDVQVFAGTFGYAVRLDFPLGVFTNDGTGLAKVFLNPDTGKWEIASLTLNDPQLLP